MKPNELFVTVALLTRGTLPAIRTRFDRASSSVNFSNLWMKNVDYVREREYDLTGIPTCARARARAQTRASTLIWNPAVQIAGLI